MGRNWNIAVVNSVEGIFFLQFFPLFIISTILTKRTESGSIKWIQNTHAATKKLRNGLTNQLGPKMYCFFVRLYSLRQPVLTLKQDSSEIEKRKSCRRKSLFPCFFKNTSYSLTNCNVYRPCWSEMSRLFWRPIRRPTVCPFEWERCQGFPELHRKKKKNRWTLSHNKACQLFYYAKYCIYIDKTRRCMWERASHVPKRI